MRLTLINLLAREASKSTTQNIKIDGLCSLANAKFVNKVELFVDQ
jgi:hypothetical protein